MAGESIFRKICIRARVHSLPKDCGCERYVSGHDFTACRKMRILQQNSRKIRAAEPTMPKRFVSGHNFSCAEKFLIHWALAPAELANDCNVFFRKFFSRADKSFKAIIEAFSPGRAPLAHYESTGLTFLLALTLILLTGCHTEQPN